MPASPRHLPDVRPEFVALGFLEAEPLHGYEIHQRYERALGRVWHLSQSQLYLILKRLAVQGLILSQEGGKAAGRGRRVLSITQAGRERFEEWLRSPSDCGSRIIRLEFISRLYFARESRPELLPALIAGQKEAMERQLRNHRALLASLPADDTFNRLSVELRIGQLAGVQAWIEGRVSSLCD